MFDSVIILILLVLSSVASAQQTLGSQDVEIRGTNDKVNLDGVGGGQPRTIHSQRHLSPHRMMHFGKRLQILPPPTIMTPQRVYDLYQRAQPPMQLEPIVVQQQRQQLQSDKYPFLLSLELERGQTLQALPEAADAFELLQPSRNLVYNFAPQQVAMDRLRAQDEERAFSKLINTDENMSIEDGSSSPSLPEQTVNSDRSHSQDDTSSSPQRSINVSQRSVPRFSLPKAYISNLYGRQSASQPGFSSYNKKAEPKNNLFMHFGRK